MVFCYSPSWKYSISFEWVYKIKYNSIGSIECYKTCLVTKGIPIKKILTFLKHILMLPKC